MKRVYGGVYTIERYENITDYDERMAYLCEALAYDAAYHHTKSAMLGIYPLKDEVKAFFVRELVHLHFTWGVE